MYFFCRCFLWIIIIHKTRSQIWVPIDNNNFCNCGCVDVWIFFRQLNNMPKQLINILIDIKRNTGKDHSSTCHYKASHKASIVEFAVLLLSLLGSALLLGKPFNY